MRWARNAGVAVNGFRRTGLCPHNGKVFFMNPSSCKEFISYLAVKKQNTLFLHLAA
jgi:hypothetical protein